MAGAVKNTWKKIERHLASADPDAHEALRPPADAGALEDAAKALGATLPEELRASLGLHDGMAGEDLFELWRPLPAAEIVEQWRSLIHLLEAGEFDECGTEHDKKVQDGWFRRGWIPFAADGYGNLVCVDIDPGPRGKVGQVVVFWHDDAERKVEAASLLAWMRRVARELPKQETSTAPTPVVVGQHAFRDPKAAQICAVKGEPDLAIEALRGFVAQGDASAAGALSLLLAFRGRWEESLELSAIVLANTDEFHHMNVPFEHCKLAVRAGVHTGRWDDVAAAVRRAKAGSAGNGPARANKSAKAREDLLNVPDGDDELSEADNAAAYAAYLEKGAPSTYSHNETQRTRHHFIMAVRYRRWDAVRRLFAEHPESCHFDDAIEVARFVEVDEAWPMILASLSRWCPVYYAQVAPAELLTEPVVREWMTPERCEQVLATPRVHHWWDYRRT